MNNIQNGILNESIAWTLSDDGTLTVTGTNPEYHGTAGFSPVEKEGDPFDRKNVKKLVVEEGIEQISEKGFYHFTALAEVILSSSLQVIGEEAFSGCISLTSLVLSEGLKVIGNSAFNNCRILSVVHLPSSLRKIDDYAFSNCTSLKEIRISPGLRYIGNFAFQSCVNLRSIAFPASVENIKSYIFLDCPKLETITVDPGNKVYDSRNDCNALIETKRGKLILGCDGTVIPEGITEIAEAAISFCSNLEKIAIPDSVRKIGPEAFRADRNLKEVTLSGGFAGIPRNCFAQCSALRRVEIPAGIKTIGENAFYDCEDLSELILPEGLESIESFAFYNCHSLETVVLPDSVKKLGNGTFTNTGNNTLIITGQKKTADKFSYNNVAVLYTGGPLDDITLYARKEAVQGLILALHKNINTALKWKDSYISYIKKDKASYLDMVLRNEDKVLLGLLLEHALLTEAETESLLNRTVSAKLPEMTSSLLEYQKDHFENKKNHQDSLEL